MRQLFLIFSLFTAILMLSGCADEKPSGPNRVCSLKIEGMMCEKGCKSTVESKLSKMEGVAEAKVDFENGIALVKFDSGITSCKAMIDMIGGIADGQYSATVIEESDLGITAPDDLNSGKSNEASVEHFRFEVPDISHLLRNIF
jgi:copper chaperone CopZ